MKKQMQKQQIQKIIHLWIKLIRKLSTDQLDPEAIRTSATNKRHLRTLFAATDHRKAWRRKLHLHRCTQPCYPHEQETMPQEKVENEKKAFWKWSKKLFRKRNAIFKEESW